MLKSHCEEAFAKAGIYSLDLREVFKEKLPSPLLSVNSQDNQASPIARRDSNDTLFHRDQRAEIRRTIDLSSSRINLSINGKRHIITLKILSIILQLSIPQWQDLKLQLLLSIFNWFRLMQQTTVLKHIKENNCCQQYVREKSLEQNSIMQLCLLIILLLFRCFINILTE